ncbi:MAG TPA: chromate efflux transporter [Ktedonobacteraceae bacterium]|nr:chromate efflux transporter [Ktedonobacteraceae bacterium]
MAQTYWQKLRSIAALFLRLGIIGFGGPLAHIGLMEDAYVKRRQWTTREEFLEGLAVCNLLPGPTSTQLSIYLGYLYGGIPGGLVSGTCFIAPAFVLVLILSWAYIQYGALPAVDALFVGIGPVVVAIIVNTLYRSSKTALTTISSWCIGILACVFTVLPLLPPSFNLVTILLLSGLVGMLIYGRPHQSSATPKTTDVSEPTEQKDEPSNHKGTLKSIAFSPLLAAKTLVYALPTAAVSLVTLSLVFVKIGLLMFGGGLVVAPLLQQELVDGPHWLTTRQLLDGLALGQLTPGPVTVVATFAGYAVSGVTGAIVATVSVFLPSFILVLSLTPLLRRIRNAPLAKAFLKGITAGALGAIAAAAILLGRLAIVDVLTAAIAFVSLLLLLRWNVNTIFLIAGAALIGLVRMVVVGG